MWLPCFVFFEQEDVFGALIERIEYSIEIECRIEIRDLTGLQPTFTLLVFKARLYFCNGIDVK